MRLVESILNLICGFVCFFENILEIVLYKAPCHSLGGAFLGPTISKNFANYFVFLFFAKKVSSWHILFEKHIR